MARLEPTTVPRWRFVANPMPRHFSASARLEFSRARGDEDDGLSRTSSTGHPWAVCCSCSFARLYYELAAAIDNGAPVPDDQLAAAFLSRVSVSSTTPSAQVTSVLRTSRREHARPIIFPSN